MGSIVARASNTDAAWEDWGKSDPYYGVLSVPQFRRGRLAENLGEFFSSGWEYISGRLALAQRLYGSTNKGRALDFGCGVGRLLIPLAHHFDEAVGVDVSDAMLEECRANLFRQAVSNAATVKSDDALSAVTGTFDFVHSYIVLQHIPVVRGMALISRLLDLTAPGGVASLQVTLDREDRPLQALVYWAQRRVPAFQMAVNVLRRRDLSEPLVQMNEYSLPAVLRLFQARGFGPVTTELEQQGRVLSVNLMAQRSH